MNRIRLLPEQVANQIAAGEVIERPASVVKELVENALDAAARNITVEIQAGGRSLIRVVDDGSGMNRDDALLCLERHATSKLRVADDLRSITTMGFRGEAIPSIASVSRMMLTTRERDGGSPEGTQVIIHGGKIIEVKAAGRAEGTTMEVRNLFFNLPARKKFLRTEETERTHIHHYLTLAALAHPAVAFTFIQDERTIWQLPAATRSQSEPAPELGTLRRRMLDLPGSEKKLLPVYVRTELEPSFASENENENQPKQVTVWGLIGQPGVSRSSREDQHVFVNRRPVENRGLNFALLEGYHTALMKGRYPVCCLFIELDPAEIDVNIHPAKREVRFHQESAVRRLVAQAVQKSLLEFHSKTAEAAPAIATTKAQPATPAPLVAPVVQPQAQSVLRPPELGLTSPSAHRSTPVPKQTGIPRSDSFAPTATPNPSNAAVQAPSPPPSSEPMPLLNVPLSLIGVVGKLYVVMESDRGLVLMDQHAAHERILFEQMLTRLERGEVPSQRLLLPETIELSTRDATFVREQLPTLNRLGIGLSEFGEKTFLLDALPPFVKAPDARRFTIEVIDELKAGGDGLNSWRLGEQMIAKTVCRHAVKANDPLSMPELEKLVEDLRRCQMPYTCPHGRPTLVEMNFRELERKFGRTQ